MGSPLPRDRQCGAIANGRTQPRLLTGALRDWLIARAARDLTLRGLVAELLAEFGVKMDYVQVWRFVHDEGLSFKKSVLPAEQLRPKAPRHRERWQKHQKKVDPARLMKLGSKPIWRHSAVGRLWGGVCMPGCHTVTGKR